MSRDKQIEEMAKVIKLSLDGLGAGNFNFTGDEISTMFAEVLYNAGYRKAEEIFADLDKTLGELAMKYSDEGFNEYFGVCEEIFTKVIYPIKKKYTEVTERRKGVENSPVDYSTPNVTDQKGEGE